MFSFIFFCVIGLLIYFCVMHLETAGKPSSGGTPVLRREFIWDKNPCQILGAAQILLDHLNNSSIHEWIYVIRQSRHPDFLWEINYIKPSNTLIDINSLIVQSEKILFENDTDIVLKPEFSADVGILNFFNIIRAYIKAENGHISKAMNIWDALYSSKIGQLSAIRQTNLLCHLHSAYLCAGNFEKSYSCYLKQLTLLKITKYKDQHQHGMWDNVFLMHILQCFFCKHIPKYNTFMSKQIDITERSLLIHKKTSFMKFISMQMIVQLCSKPFYDYARSIMPDLPSYDESSFTKSSITTQRKAQTPYSVKI